MKKREKLTVFLNLMYSRSGINFPFKQLSLPANVAARNLMKNGDLKTWADAEHVLNIKLALPAKLTSALTRDKLRVRSRKSLNTAKRLSRRFFNLLRFLLLEK